ncbi:MAG: hypothetical protein OEO84_05990 [Betaproteobacteria bacterium]|nr:hypothetical protein [Betaproteobacteria bacterium]
MSRILVTAVLFAALAGCGTTLLGRDRCAATLDLAWKELDIAKVEGFAGSVSYAKAVGLLTAAKTQQTLENFDRCVDEAGRARFYIGESRRGR